VSLEAGSSGHDDLAVPLMARNFLTACATLSFPSRMVFHGVNLFSFCRRWEDVIRKDVREIGQGGVEWIQLAQDTGQWGVVVNAVMNLGVLAPS
jgi:hypothetical protein